MANVYDGGDQGMFSVAPPPAPIPGALRQARGRLGGMRHIGALAKLHPNHPIFKKFPGLAAFVHRSQAGGPLPPGTMPPGVAPPASFSNPPGGGNPDPSAGQTPPAAVADPMPMQDWTQGGKYPWMQAPATSVGLNQWGAPPEPQGADPQAAFHHAAGGFAGNARDRLMSKYHTAMPHPQPMTSKGALTAYLQQRTAQRNNSVRARPNVLPARRPRAY